MSKEIQLNYCFMVESTVAERGGCHLSFSALQPHSCSSGTSEVFLNTFLMGKLCQNQNQNLSYLDPLADQAGPGSTPPSTHSFHLKNQANAFLLPFYHHEIHPQLGENALQSSELPMKS